MSIDAQKLSMSQLNALKAQQVSQLLSVVRPQLQASKLSNREGKPVMAFFFRDENQATKPVSLPNSPLPPLYAVTEEGVIYNGYGNAATRAWQDLALEDVLKLTEQVELLVASHIKPAVEPCQEPETGWTVDGLDTLDRQRTMARLWGRQRVNGVSRPFSLAIKGMQRAEELFNSCRGKWAEGTLSLEHPSLQGTEALLTA